MKRKATIFLHRTAILISSGAKNLHNPQHLSPQSGIPPNPQSLPDKWDMSHRCHLLSRDSFQACCKVKQQHPTWQKSWRWWPKNYPSKNRLVGSHVLPWPTDKGGVWEGPSYPKDVERCWYRRQWNLPSLRDESLQYMCFFQGLHDFQFLKKRVWWICWW